MSKAKIRPWLYRKKIPQEAKSYSVINKFLRDGKIDQKFVEQVGGLSLEDLLAIKLEQASRQLAGKLYGLPIYYALPRICRDAAVKYALSASRTYTEAAAFLGVSIGVIDQYRHKHNLDSFFENKP